MTEKPAENYDEEEEMITDTITGITGSWSSGLATIEFESGNSVQIESGFGIRQLMEVFNDEPIGKRITYKLADYGNVMESFSIPRSCEDC